MTRLPKRVRDLWWVSWGAATSVAFGMSLARIASEIARTDLSWELAPITLLYGSFAYYIVLGCVRRTSWLQERHVRRMRRLMSRG